jgi:hypothetical protein
VSDSAVTGESRAYGEEVTRDFFELNEAGDEVDVNGFEKAIEDIL